MLAAVGGGLGGVPDLPKARYHATTATPRGTNHSTSRRRAGVVASITTPKAAKVRPIPENITEAAARATASAKLLREGRAWSTSSMPRPHATDASHAIWKAHRM